MQLIDPEAIGHYPYYIQHIGPGPWPTLDVRFLNHEDALPRCRQKTLCGAAHKVTWIALGPKRSLKYRYDWIRGQARVSLEPSRPPVGFFMATPIYWDWQEGLKPKRRRKLLIAVKKMREVKNMGFVENYPFVAVIMDETRFYIGALKSLYQTPLSCQRARAAAYAVSERRTCYLALDERRNLRFDPDGSCCAVESLPERQWFTHVPVHDWSEIPDLVRESPIDGYC